MAVVERHRSGHITTADATLDFLRILPENQRGEGALRRYVELCTQIDRDHTIASVRGDAEQQVRRSTRLRPQTDVLHSNEERQRDEEEEASHADTDSTYQPTHRGSKRTHSDSESSDSDASKSRKPCRAKFSWRKLSSPGKPEDLCLAKTLSLKANHLRDLKLAKNDLLSRIDCPNFPDGLWVDVLADRFIDLDKVFAGYYSLESDQKLTESIGNIDITLSSGSGSSKPSRTVNSHGEWSIAFAVAKRAILYVFPHRAEELAEYEEYIIGLFAAVQDSGQHHRVLDLDRAIRVRVAKDNKLSLTSFAKFHDLYTRHVVAFNPVTRRDNKRPRFFPGPSQPICRRFNAGHCPGDGCRYRHICTACSGRHPQKDCSIQNKTGGPK
jgi:hypothetical protein